MCSHALIGKLPRPHGHLLLRWFSISAYGRSNSGIWVKSHTRQTNFLRLTLAAARDVPFATPYTTSRLHCLGKDTEVQHPPSGIIAPRFLPYYLMRAQGCQMSTLFISLLLQSLRLRRHSLPSGHVAMSRSFDCRTPYSHSTENRGFDPEIHVYRSCYLPTLLLSF